MSDDAGRLRYRLPVERLELPDVRERLRSVQAADAVAARLAGRRRRVTRTVVPAPPGVRARSNPYVRK
jgi:hypothetical protein